VALRPNAGHSFLILDVSRSHKEAPQSVGLLTSDRSFTEPVLDNTQHSQQRNIHAPAGFEPAVSAGEWSHTYALDRAPTGTGTL